MKANIPGHVRFLMEHPSFRVRLENIDLQTLRGNLILQGHGLVPKLRAFELEPWSVPRYNDAVTATLTVLQLVLEIAGRPSDQGNAA